MSVLTRRLHMGCGETLQSHLPENFRKILIGTNEVRQRPNVKDVQLQKKGRTCK